MILPLMILSMDEKPGTLILVNQSSKCKRHAQRPMKLLASYRRAFDRYRVYAQLR